MAFCLVLVLSSPKLLITKGQERPPKYIVCFSTTIFLSRHPRSCFVSCYNPYHFIFHTVIWNDFQTYFTHFRFLITFLWFFILVFIIKSISGAWYFSRCLRSIIIIILSLLFHPKYPINLKVLSVVPPNYLTFIFAFTLYLI